MEMLNKTALRRDAFAHIVLAHILFELEIGKTFGFSRVFVRIR